MPSTTSHQPPDGSEPSNSLEYSAGLQALERLPGAWASDEARDEDEIFFRQQADEAGIQESDIEQLYEDMRQGRVLLADVLGFTSDQLAAMNYRGNELLRNNEPRRALSIYLALYELDPFNYHYQRSAAQCFHAIKEYGFALGYYRLAMATLGKEDFVCLALIGECLLFLEGKEAALSALDQALSLGSQDKQDQVYMERAQVFRKRLNLADAKDPRTPSIA